MMVLRMKGTIAYFVWGFELYKPFFFIVSVSAQVFSCFYHYWLLLKVDFTDTFDSVELTLAGGFEDKQYSAVCCLEKEIQ